MFNNSSVSVPVSDEDEEEFSSKTRLLVRRKRRKPSGFRGKKDLAPRVVKLFIRWWPVLLFLPAAALLSFEATRIGRKSTPVLNSEVVTHNRFKFTVENGSGGNLNRLDPTTRVIGGVRTRCLKLLPPAEVEDLEIPVEKEYAHPIKKVIFLSENEMPDITQSIQHMESTNFNMFTGNQTLEQREQSYKVNKTARVHCGFYSESGGFKISDEDKSYLKNCKVVVSTCAFGGGDDLYQPIGMTEASLKKVCYVAFWDEVTLSTQEAQGQKIGDNHFIGNWRIVIVKNLPFRDQRLNGKIPKMLAHRLFPNARYSIWVDSKSQFRRDPLGVLEALLWRSNSVLAISEHGARSSVYDEAKAVVKKNKASPEEVAIQLSQYRKDGLPEDKRFSGKKALAEASVIVREHTPLTNLLMCLWFNEVVRFTSRDQLSFPYVMWRIKLFKDIHMIPVCTRKDLVNSMGHIRKAKPLIH